MAKFVAVQAGKLPSKLERLVKELRVAVIGSNFKENVRHLRNSWACDIIHELWDYGMHVIVRDPFAVPGEAVAKYGLSWCRGGNSLRVDEIVLAAARLILNSEPLWLATLPSRCLVDLYNAREVVRRQTVAGVRLHQLFSSEVLQSHRTTT